MKVVMKTPIYSKKNGIVYKGITQFEGTEDECKKYVLDNYGQKIELKQQIQFNGLISVKYVSLKK